MGLTDFTDQIARGVGNVAGAVTRPLTAPFQDTVIRLGVTGLSRAGKTVFITSLVANLMNRGRMPQLRAAATGAIQAAYLQPQPDDTLPRFDYENYLSQLTARDPRWPEGTRHISELRLSLRVQPSGMLAGIQGPRTVHLDIVDYPGEWLLDLALLEQDFATWSAAALGRAERRPKGAAFLRALAETDPTAKLDEPHAQKLAQAYTDHLQAARAEGFSDCTPGRFLLPGDLAGSPVLTFAPLPPGTAPHGSLAREFDRRFEAYKRHVVRPFFRDHFSRIDRQVVLVDVLGAINAGPRALHDLRQAMAEILTAFNPGKNGFISRIFQGRRVEKILFAATKADHLHHTQHPQLTALTKALLRDARDRADFAGAATEALSIAALRTTVEETVDHRDGPLDVVRGRLLDSGKEAAFYPGLLPTDPSHLLSPARDGADAWGIGDYKVMRFAPATLTLDPGEGPPHIRLDRAAEFLIGDRL
ncbi:YcjX family protein [Salipiger sp. IMCC34102]|uniref:YcjX family protein n=1 Tax=Salipiger sp. IMCC34102 TaxID=2510647 RepID=UPI00101DBCC6|nr:YcjX family protein [Salipiger sp. IMCC34102]RYH02179.1 YcjX family protein [Salipiger sp. IMCC34102]